ncbi:hypothetical protein GCM10027048_42710 [Hymenobacter coalescens]
MSKKTTKLAKAQRTSGATTSAEHPDPQARKKRQGPSTGTIVGASLLALGAGVLIALTRRSWPIKEAQRAATGQPQPVDTALNAEVAGATQSSPKSANSFTDEGATGNND